MRRSGVSLVVYLSLVFLSGALVGGFSHKLITTSAVKADSKSKKPGPEEYRKHYLDIMRKHLDLTPEQLPQLEQILDKTKERYEALENNVWKPGTQEIRQEQTEAIMAILTPEQQAKYTQLREERARHRKDKGRKSGPPPPGRDRR